MGRKGLLGLGLALLLAACGTPPPVTQVALPPPPTRPQVLVDPDAACRADLAQEHVEFDILDSFGQGQCSIANPVRLKPGGALPLPRPTVLSCSTADVMAHFVSEVVEPLARKHFHRDIKTILHFGTYDCRAVRTETKSASGDVGGSKGGRLSEHSKGRAIDFSGVELSDGQVISVKTHWHAGGEAGAFLHDVARESCKRFNVVLTPNHDRLHADHIHLDTGPHVLCGY